MPKSIKDLNWGLLLINVLGAICVGYGICYLAKVSTIEGYLLAIGACVAKDAGSFFSNAKKELSGK